MSISSFAELYDHINQSAYLPYADFLEDSFKKSEIKVSEVLDMGCGTGGIAAILADRGYDMIALDISPEMLNLARERNEGKNTLLLCQDMCDFELYGTVQAVYSSFDCLNYITSKADLKRVFALVHNYLEKGGLFIFDINTLHRFESTYDGRCYAYEVENDMAVWQNSYDKEEKLCTFLIDIFSEEEDGSYYRLYEAQTQKYHSHEDILACAKGFSLLEISGGKGFDGCSTEEKAYYIFRRD